MLLLAGGVLALGVIAALVTLRTLDTPGVAMRVGSALSDALERPVTIGRVSASLLPRPSLTARDVHVGGGAPDEPNIALAEVRAMPRLTSLLPGRPVQISRADLMGLVISVRRDSLGRWHLPLPPQRSGDSARTARRGLVLADLRVHDGAIRVIDDRLSDSSGAPAVTTISHIDARLHAAGGDIALPTLRGRVGTTDVTGSAQIAPRGARLQIRSASLRPPDLPSFMTLLGMRPYPGLAVSGTAPFDATIFIAPGFTSHSATGHAAFEQVRLGRLELGDVAAPYRFDHGRLTIEPFTFTAYGGRERGTVTVDLTQPVARYAIRANLDGAEAALLLRGTTSTRDLVAGRTSASAVLRGSGHMAADLRRSLQGTVGFEIRDGVLRGLPLVSAIDRALGVTTGDARDTRFERLSGTGRVQGGTIRSDDLALKAGELTLSGKGSLDFDHHLDLHLSAAFSPALSERLVRQASVLRRLRTPAGRLVLPLTVTGTTTAPYVAVDVKTVAARQLQGELAQGLLQLLGQQ
jgi:uncharacterized protein involved in outer membrane biogenesis